MSNLTSIEKLKFEKLFDMESGYVLNFSNRTFEQFFLENGKIEIYNSDYDYSSGSKANRLRAFWNKNDNISVGMMLNHLLEYWKVRKEIDELEIIPSELKLYNDCVAIAERLTRNNPIKNKNESSANDLMELEKRNEQLKSLLDQFDGLANSTDYQKRGLLLEGLLTKLFEVYQISVKNSFHRNAGGEQIDGAFSLNGWFYLVECKWTNKAADIRALDSLIGKVNRSGKQTMGLFLSIEGWSKNIIPLLKQNSNKCIILMEGYDLRCVLSQSINLKELLNAKIERLNLEGEPYLGAYEILEK